MGARCSRTFYIEMIAVNDFYVEKYARCNRMLVLTELVESRPCVIWQDQTQYIKLVATSVQKLQNHQWF